VSIDFEAERRRIILHMLMEVKDGTDLLDPIDCFKFIIELTDDNISELIYTGRLVKNFQDGEVEVTIPVIATDKKKASGALVRAMVPATRKATVPAGSRAKPVYRKHL
jgi:hypothetical protein